MSKFDNKTKPELEAGNYLVYTDEPGTVVSPGSGGGGGGFTVFNGVLADDGITVVVDFSYADIIGAVGEGNPVFLYIVGPDLATTMFLMTGTDAALGVYTVKFDVITFSASDETSTMTMQPIG